MSACPLFLLLISAAAPVHVQGRLVNRAEKPIAGAELLFFSRAAPMPVLRVAGSRHEAALDHLWGPLSDEAAEEVVRLASAPDFATPPVARARTAADGSYQLPALGPDVDVFATWASGKLAYSSPVTDWWPEVLMVDPRPREVLVIDAQTRRPLVGAVVTVIPLSPRWGPPLTSRTDARGSVSLAAVASGHRGLIIVRAEGYVAEADPGLSSVLPKDQVTVELRRPAPLKGQVMEKGRPVPGARVEVVGSFTTAVTTGPDGRFELRAPACLACAVRAERGSMLGLTRVYLPRDVLSTIELAPSGALKVRVVDSVTGVALKARFSWPGSAPDEALVGVFREEAPGTFTATGVTAGVHRLVVQADEYVGQDFRFRHHGGSLELVVPMAREHLVRGRLLPGGPVVHGGSATLLSAWAGSPPVKGALVEKSEPPLVKCELDEFTIQFEVAASGDFEVELPAGDYLFRFEEAGEPDFFTRVPESSPRYCHWLHETFGVDTPRRRGDLMMEHSSRWSEQRVRVPLTAPVTHRWRAVEAEVVVDVREPGGAKAGSVSVVIEGGGRVRAAEWFNDGEARFLLPPGSYTATATAMEGTSRGRAPLRVGSTAGQTSVRVQLR